MAKLPTARPPGNPAAQIQADIQSAFRLQQSGQADQAAAIYERVLRAAPHQPDALNLLGIILSDKSEHSRAVSLITRAAQLRPRDPNVLNNLGNACMRDGRYDEAIEALERAIALKPDLAEAYGNLILAHRQAGHVDEAFHYVEALRKLKGPSVTSENEAARLYADMGRREESRAILLKLTKENPQFGPAWLALAETQKVKPGDALLGDILAAIEKASEPSVTLKFLCYAAGKALDDLGEYDRAFGFYQRAKAQEPYLYNPVAEEKRFDAIKRVFDKGFFEARAHVGVESRMPIFIVGMPRSGTSLTEQILSSHPDVAGGGELQYLGQAAGRASEYALTEAPFPELARALTPNAVAGLAFLYLRKIASLNLGKPRVTDKMPHNFMHLGLASLMFKNLTIVHCLRHPFDTCLSAYMHEFTVGHAYNRKLEGLAHYYNLYRDLMNHWRDVLPTDILDLQYETMIDNQEERTRALLDHAGLGWTEAALAFHETERRVGTPSNWQVRAPLYKTSSGRWRNYEKHLGPLMEGVRPDYLL